MDELKTDHLTSAYSQIISKSIKLKTVSHFLAIDPDQENYKSLESSVINLFVYEKSFKRKSLSNFLYEVIKKRLNFSDFITSI